MTGQYPKRRESDAAAARRVEELERRQAEHMKGARRLNFIEEALLPRPRISASGRLMTDAIGNGVVIVQ